MYPIIFMAPLPHWLLFHSNLLGFMRQSSTNSWGTAVSLAVAILAFLFIFLSVAILGLGG